MQNDLNEKEIVTPISGKKNKEVMMGMGLVGSKKFCTEYQIAFTQTSDISINQTCLAEEFYSDSDCFNRLLQTSEVIFFENANKENISSILSTLKNGRKVMIDFLDIPIEDLEELVKISNEGEIKCIVANHTNFCGILSEWASKFTKPSWIEISLEMELQSTHTKNVSHPHWIYEQLLKLRYFFKSDFKSISAHSAKIFSQNTNMLSLRLDFLNNCVVKIDLSEVSFENKHMMKVVQADKILWIDFIKSEIQIGSVSSMEPENLQPVLKKIPFPKNDNYPGKIHDLLMELRGSKSGGISLLDHYLALDLTSKILKKINSLHH